MQKYLPHSNVEKCWKRDFLEEMHGKLWCKKPELHSTPFEQNEDPTIVEPGFCIFRHVTITISLYKYVRGN